MNHRYFMRDPAQGATHHSMALRAALSALVCVFGLWAAFPAVGQQELPSVDDIVMKLAPRSTDEARSAALTSAPAPRKRRTRGVVLEEDEAGDNAPVAAEPQHTPARPVNDIAAVPARVGYSESRITFDVDSDRLTPYARRVLDVFASAIQSPQLKKVQFVIEGHTDGSGSDAYNLELSRKRAESVIRYLVNTAQIDPGRLAAKGKGRRELLNPDDPGAAENRRVVWVSQQ